MEMLRWLAANRIVQTIWGLGILTMLMSSVFGGGKAAHEPAAGAETAAVETLVEVKAEPAAQAVSDAAAPAVQALVATDAVVDVTESVAVDAAATVTETVEVVAADAAVEAAVVETTEVASESTEATVEVTEAAAETTAETTDATVETAAVLTEEVAPVAETEATSDIDAGGFADKSTADLLVMAREAYWNNGLDESAEIYKVLIEREPSVIEHKGELGNVLWRQGYPKQAAELYADIAAPMIEKGNVEIVSNMVGFIGLFFPERAVEIRALLDAK